MEPSRLLEGTINKIKIRIMKSNNVLGVVAGLAAGALLGVLFAPDKGSKTRKKIKNKTIEAKKNLKEEFDNFLDTISKKYNSLVDKEEDLVEKEKEIIKDAVNSKN
jgi:gas vesicle protein